MWILRVICYAFFRLDYSSSNDAFFNSVNVVLGAITSKSTISYFKAMLIFISVVVLIYWNGF